MASMMGRDLVEAYVLKNAYKEKMRRMDQAAVAALDGAKSSKDDKEAVGAAREKKLKAGGARITVGFFGLVKKKVHPKPKVVAAASSSSYIDRLLPACRVLSS
uniref:Uncharacterized protein n=1 Tax=Hordeum vulgare subsp. vulgare TaxID=112509 RepID=A0A8I6Y838_HORVV